MNKIEDIFDRVFFGLFTIILVAGPLLIILDNIATIQAASLSFAGVFAVIFLGCLLVAVYTGARALGKDLLD